MFDSGKGEWKNNVFSGVASMSMRDDVFGFIEVVGQVDEHTGRVTDSNTIEIYSNLVDEEYKEFIEAPFDADKLNEAMDLVWVTIGYCIAREWDVEGAWKELTKANMAKLQVDPATGYLKRRDDGKILKPAGWVKPDMTTFLNRRSEHHG